MKYYLSIDVGGTNTTVGLLRVSGASIQEYTIITYKSFKSREHTSLESILDEIIPIISKECKLSVTPPISISACGPTNGVVCQPTNLPDSWNINKISLEKRYNTPIYLINDFSAIAYGLQTIHDENDKRITHIPTTPTHNFSSDKDAIKVALGAGTGLGCATIYSSKEGTQLLPSEAGWYDFSPNLVNPVECQYAKYLVHISQNYTTTHPFHTMHGTFSWEDAICGSRGLLNIYNFFCNQEFSVEHIPEELRKTLIDTLANIPVEKKGIEMSKLALKNDPACKYVLRFWIGLYARFASQIALITIPQGGMYIGGGVASKNLKLFLEDEMFSTIFTRHNNDTIRNLLHTIPLYIITDYYISLYGNAYYLHHQLQRKKKKNGKKA